MKFDDPTGTDMLNQTLDSDSGSNHSADTSSPPGKYLHGLEFLYLDHFPGSHAVTSSANGCHIDEFLQYHDQYFVRHAYLGILQREPDPDGYHYYLSGLRNAALTKPEILGRLRYSKEGREKAVKIKGLLLNFLAQTSFRIPLLGYLLRLFVGMLKLPVYIKNYQKLDLYTHTQFIQLSEYLNRTTGLIQSNVNEIISNLTASLETLASVKADKSALNALASKLESSVPELSKLKFILDNMSHRVDEINLVKSDLNLLRESVALKADMNNVLTILKGKAEVSDFTRLEEAIEEINGRKADLSLVEQLLSTVEGIDASKVDRSEFESWCVLNQTNEREILTLNHIVQHLRRTLTEQERKLWLFLHEAKQRLPEPFAENQIEKLVSEEDHLLDAMYATFEDQFRGTRFDIKNRLRVYVPYIEEAGAGTVESPVVDLGCGRGEWLEILKDSNLHAVGIDCNRIMLQQCRELNLEVFENDAIRFLQRENANRFGAITGHHLVEHLDLAALIILLDECYRTLKPGGILIFETPNPENLLVGAYTFHYDPTHKSPLVPDSLKFLVEQRGFSQAQILRLNRYSDLYQVNENSDDFRNKWFYSEMDFAIIGYKP